MANCVDSTLFKDALSRYVTGVAVITTHYDDQDWGMTCNSFASVSLDPPLVMWCIRKNSNSHHAYVNSGRYLVNVLAANQQRLALKFTQGSHLERFQNVGTQRLEHHNLKIDSCSAWFDCAVEQIISAGDHDILLGRVHAAGTHAHPSLVYGQRTFGTLQAFSEIE